MDSVDNSFFNRLEQLRKFYKIKSGRAFSEKIGISNGNYNSYKSGTQPTLPIMVNILSNIVDLNPSWLLLGEEPMFLESKKEVYFDSANKEERLLRIIESQQDTIISQQRMIEIERKSKKGIAGAV